MSKLAIKVKDIGKAYQLGQFTSGTLANDFKRWWALSRGKDDPFLKIGETNDRTKKGKSNVVWSLKDVSFEVNQGDAIGIIGKNGAGKSTLLKILSQVTVPSIGSVGIRGRVASLLEVGTGFHPELSGRENIFLNGAILGMRKAEISKKFDEIVDFSGVERYLETPVKRYSSGMYVRLAFAVAAHLESEILIVDEVLAVGDAEFQRKCLGKMGDVSKEDGRTILFVSHNMAAIKNLCNRGLVLKNGTKNFEGNIDECIDSYLNHDTLSDRAIIKDVSLAERDRGNQKAIKKIWLENGHGMPTNTILMGESVSFCFEFDLDLISQNINLGFGVDDSFGSRLFSMNNEFTVGEYYQNVKGGVVRFTLPELNLMAGAYFVSPSIVQNGIEWIDFLPHGYGFHVEGADIFGTGKLPSSAQGIIAVMGKMQLEKTS
jgi:lipopolysaccharide transport system ATP-binding protein